MRHEARGLEERTSQTVTVPSCDADANWSPFADHAEVKLGSVPPGNEGLDLGCARKWLRTCIGSDTFKVDQTAASVDAKDLESGVVADSQHGAAIGGDRDYDVV
jgi:hypothetical protein